jgi:hypothetical protein
MIAPTCRGGKSEHMSQRYREMRPGVTQGIVQQKKYRPNLLG